MCSRQSVRCPGWTGPNCNPATVFEYLIHLTPGPRKYSWMTLRKACILETANFCIKWNLKASPEWTHVLHFFLCYQCNRGIDPTRLKQSRAALFARWKHDTQQVPHLVWDSDRHDALTQTVWFSHPCSCWLGQSRCAHKACAPAWRVWSNQEITGDSKEPGTKTRSRRSAVVQSSLHI